MDWTSSRFRPQITATVHLSILDPLDTYHRLCRWNVSRMRYSLTNEVSLLKTVGIRAYQARILKFMAASSSGDRLFRCAGVLSAFMSAADIARKYQTEMDVEIAP